MLSDINHVFDSDISCFPPSSILSNHSHRIYHSSGSSPSSSPATSSTSSLLNMFEGASSTATAVPRRCPIHQVDASRDFRTGSPSSPMRRSPANSNTNKLTVDNSYSYRTSHTSRQISPAPPPTDGSTPASDLPDEIWLNILGHLSHDHLLGARLVNKHFSHLALSPCLHRRLTIHLLPPFPLPSILVNHILPSLHHLHFQLFPFPSTSFREPHPSAILAAMFAAVPPDQLLSLSLPFSAPYLSAIELGEALTRIGGKLEYLDLRGSGLVGSSYLSWMDMVGSRGRGLRELDLAFTSISSLPLASTQQHLSAETIPQTIAGPNHWATLRQLSLASCTSLSSTVLGAFLSRLPANIETLDISRLEQVTLTALRGLRVITEESAEFEDAGHATALREIKLVGIDHLTRSNIRSLKRHWEDQRRALLPTLATTFNYTSAPAMRVWGEPRTPPHQRRTMDLDAEAVFGLQHGLADSALGEEEMQTPSTPALTSRCSSASSQSSAGTWSSVGSHVGSSNIDIISMPRASVLSSHAALWGSLADDRAEGLFATDDVYTSKLPQNPYLPSRSAPRCGLQPSATILTSIPAPSSSGLTESKLAKAAAERERVRLLKVEDKVTINITHSAILESEDEEGYRLFIGQVAGGTQLPSAAASPVEGAWAPGPGLGLGGLGGIGAETAGLGSTGPGYWSNRQIGGSMGWRSNWQHTGGGSSAGASVGLGLGMDMDMGLDLDEPFSLGSV